MSFRLKKTDYNRLDLLIKYIGNYQTGAEVGVFRGDFSKQILEKSKGLLYLIDPWRKLGYEYNDMLNTDDENYKDTIQNVKLYENENRVIMIKSLSKQAANIFSDESLDFVYIDANHAYDFVKEDLELWWPKIKKGGYIAGHDYIDIDWYKDPNFAENGKDKHVWYNTYIGVFGVNPAVDEFCEKYDLYGHISNEWFGSYFINKK